MRWFLTILLLVYFLFAVWINTKPWDSWQTRNAIKDFSKEIAVGNYENAARYIVVPEGRAVDEFRAEWSHQMAGLKSDGIYMASSRKIRTYVDDMALQGRAVWTVHSNGKAADYEVLFLPRPNSAFSLYFIPLSSPDSVPQLPNEYKDLLD
jgi:hypothetical protein